MTKKEFQDKLDELNKERNAIEERKRALEREYIDSLPYKVGDKVKVTVGKNELVLFVGVVAAGYYGINVQLNKIKKDGTMSGQSAAVYHWDSIEVIEPAVATTEAK